ncbi:DUF2959 family protein [Arenicella xantha]|uniref:DUF2959 family protein n=1 Tax=Arenicella xantha TaxID=644221 RepID=A0A395JFN7_9GAMM|nr:DUF2959 family protein [Arenicella xantha]RBP48570.1 DUF2959 family protein [Arenicella xantha]
MKPIITLLMLIALSACGTVQKAQYSALEKVGVHKRDILIDRIEDTSETQQEAKKQFRSAYDELASLINVKDAGLEKKYKRMAKAVAASEDKAAELDERIQSVNRVAEDLFDEWKDELGQYQSSSLRRASEKNLQTTKARYADIYQKMKVSQSRIEPVLRVLQDNTLYLKHNLNARAVSSISGEVVIIESQVEDLIQQMEASITESNRFVKSMRNK